MSEAVRRRILGIGTLVLLTLGTVLWCVDAHQGLLSLKAGLVFGAAWLAFPQITALTSAGPPRLTWAILAGAVILVFRPRAFPVVAVLIVVMMIVEGATWILRPLSTGPPKLGKRSRRDKQPL